MSADLFSPEDVPFNLAGELIDNSTTSEGEARVRALAESEARKAQRLMDLETLANVPTDLPMNDAEQGALYREMGREEAGYKCAFHGWEADQIDCPYCLSDSPFHEL